MRHGDQERLDNTEKIIKQIDKKIAYYQNKIIELSFAKIEYQKDTDELLLEIAREVEVNRIIKKYLPKHDLEIADKTTVLDINGNTCGYIKTT